jgi:ABC-type polysaccharide/polyol phosphate export permease
MGVRRSTLVSAVAVYADLLRYRDLFESLFRRDFQARYKGSAFGVLWSVANPLLLMAVYVVVFSVLLRVGSSLHDYALYVLVGVAAWVFFSTSLTLASRSMLDYAPLIRKTRFPRQLVALSAVATQLVTFVVMLAVLLVLAVVLVPEARDTFWLAVPLAVPLVALAAGLSLALASLNVVYRDVEHLVGAILLPWFFVTPVLYSFEQIPGAAEHPTLVDVLRWGNPVTPPIEALRAPLWEGTLPSLADTVYLVVVGVVSLAVGAWVFGRVDDRIAAEL